MRTPIYLVLAAGLVGCAESPSYIYSPETQNAVTAGLPAARTPIPQEEPQGAVEVASYGITDLRTGGGEVRALHVRMIVTNDGDDMPWQLDTSRQLVSIPGEGQSRAMFVNSDAQSQPIITIARNQRHVIDLYFPLPYTIHNDAGLRQFEMLWEVTTPARVVASRTSFDRVSEEPAVAYASEGAWPYYAGYGPYWWYDPFYPSVVFFHSRPFVGRGFHGPVAVGRFGGHFHAGGPHVAGGGMHHR